MKILKYLQDKIDGLNLRERAMVLCGILLVMYFALDLFALQPLQDSQKKVQNALLQKNAEMAALNARLQQILETGKDSEEERNKLEIQQLRQDLAALDKALNEATASLVTPQQMAKLLQMVLGQTNGLRLKKVTSLGSSPLLLSGTADQAGQPGATGDETTPEVDGTVANTAYKHGLQIEFEGDFFATLEYMRKLEELEWNFFWDGISFKVIDYPEASATLSLYTISMDKIWIGV